MNKNIVLLVLVFALFFATSIIAFDNDWSKYSDEELLQIHESLDKEMLSRNISLSAELEPSSYVIGKDIPAGRYSLKNISEDNNFVNFYTYDSEEKYRTDYYQPSLFSCVWKSHDERIDLEEGQVFLFEKGRIKITRTNMLWK